MKTITYPNETPITSLERRVQQLERRLSTALSQIDTLLKGPGSFPVGTIVAYGGTYDEFLESPLYEQGWVRCDGSMVSQSEYPELFDVIGHNHARETPPSGFFYLPNIEVNTIPALEPIPGVNHPMTEAYVPVYHRIGNPDVYDPTPPPHSFMVKLSAVGIWIIRAKSAATVYAEPDVTIDTEVIDD